MAGKLIGIIAELMIATMVLEVGAKKKLNYGWLWLIVDTLW